MSGADEKKGYKVHVLSTGPLKGVGIPGAQVTDEHLQYLQSRVDEGNQFFLAAVESGRRPQFKAHSEEWKSGRVWIAAEAEKIGLIDGIGDIEDARKDLLGMIRGRALQLKS